MRARTMTICALAALSATGIATTTPALASSGSGSGSGSGGGTTSPPASATLTISPQKIAIGATGTATLTLTTAAASDTTVTIADDYQDSPAVATMPQSVTIPAGSRTGTFAIVGGDYPERTFLVHVSTSLSGVTAQFYRTPQPDTDIIAITKASQSQSGDLGFTATTDTPTAQLRASFNGISVPLTNKGNGVWEGRGQVGANQSGDIVVQSNLQACSAKNPLTPTGWHFC
jgi:hypothetical protein